MRAEKTSNSCFNNMRQSQSSCQTLQHITGHSWQVTAASSSSYAPETCTHRWGATTDDITQDAEAPPPRRNSPLISNQQNEIKYVYITFTFTLRTFSRRFYPERLTVSTFVTREQHDITVDGVNISSGFSVFYRLSSPRQFLWSCYLLSSWLLLGLNSLCT